MLAAPQDGGHAGVGRWALAAALPLLAAAYPVLFMFVNNAGEHVALDPLWLPLAAAVAGAAVVFGAMALVTRDPARASLVTTVLVASFFGYGHAWNGVAAFLPNQWPLIAAWLAVTAIALVLAWRGGSWANTAVRGLTIVVLIAVVINGFGLVQTAAVLASPDPVFASSDPVVLDGAEEPLPDIYYVVPDRYAGLDTLRSRYDYDNEPFLRALEDRGFAVARQAHANYTKTPLSLASSLNMQYLDGDALKAQARDGADSGPVHRLVRGSQVVPRALKEAGYRYIHVGGRWAPSATNVEADQVFSYRGDEEFMSVLSQTTFLRALSEPGAAPDDPLDWRAIYDDTKYVLDTLDEVPALSGPKYVFSHLVLPHPPYVFDADGSFSSRAEYGAVGPREGYRRHVTYVNKRLLGMIDRIIAESPDAVILLAADEGPFPRAYDRDEETFDWRTAKTRDLEHKFGILLAMRVPGADVHAAGFHDALTPVNAFRVIFNARFGTELPILPDIVWSHVSSSRYFDFIEITDRLR